MARTPTDMFMAIEYGPTTKNIEKMKTPLDTLQMQIVQEQSNGNCFSKNTANLFWNISIAFEFINTRENKLRLTADLAIELCADSNKAKYLQEILKELKLDGDCDYLHERRIFEIIENMALTESRLEAVLWWEAIKEMCPRNENGSPSYSDIVCFLNATIC